MLVVAVVLWAFGTPATKGALANSVVNEPASVTVVSATTVDYEEVAEPVGAAENSLEEEAGTILPVSTDDRSETVVLNESPATNQPVLGAVEVSRLERVAGSSPQAVVAVLDTGIDQNHAELRGQVVDMVNFTESITPDDRHGHGTHVAGIIAAKDHDLGVASGCSLLSVKVADDTGRCQATALAEGIIWAVDNGASILNISIEIGKYSADLEEAIDYAWEAGSLIIAAAGNNGSDVPVYPAYYENCLAVAATKQDGQLAPLSNHGDWVDVLAPGFKIYSTLPDDEYGYKSGTSFACAYVSGMAALLFDVVSDTNGDGRLNDEVRAMIESGCPEVALAGLSTG
jgi:thermitase